MTIYLILNHKVYLSKLMDLHNKEYQFVSGKVLFQKFLIHSYHLTLLKLFHFIDSEKYLQAVNKNILYFNIPMKNI